MNIELIENLKEFLVKNDINGMIINSTNEFLVEKILSSMDEDFECSTSRNCSYRPVFSTKMQAVEQAKFLKDYLRNLLKLELPSEIDFNSRIILTRTYTENNRVKTETLSNAKSYIITNPSQTIAISQ